MKILTFIFTTLIFTTCSTTENTKTFPIGFVKTNSQKQIDSINLQMLDLKKFKLIDTTFFKQWFVGLTVHQFKKDTNIL